ncbi:LysR family transcriptional regulator [Bacillus sp. FJAT-49736]|uniref:LysR family transcriptional regulator n=1 Tax=Bacillus sp. FJAT-49736 TaxID=2833582 RepID=UPI001BCA5BFD|nr:LysR family transcriptional regulator [Bacillus sp. FJAT-49736]MBS4171762.1 LysR family transcriptional regulator [Bacillus sp. FJAT-49736]
MMDIKQLRYFSTIVQEGQITRAAKKLHMAQPPLSHQLKLLEEELGVTLFERNGRKLELTQPGEILYKHAQNLLKQLEETIEEVRESNEGLRGVLALGSVKSCFAHLPQKIKEYLQKYPLVTLQLREGDTFVIGELIKNREIEVGITRMPMDLNDFSHIRLSNDPYVAVLPNELLTHSKTEISFLELKDLPLLLLHRIQGSGQYELVVNECRRHGFEPNIICECPDVSMILSLVSAGIGATIIPRDSLLTYPANHLKILEITDSSITTEAAIIWQKDRYLSKNAKYFIQMFE